MSEKPQNQVIKLARRPGPEFPNRSHFSLEECPFPVIEDGTTGIILETLYMSVDPYMRGRMNAHVNHETYVPDFEVGEPCSGHLVCKVIDSNNKDYPTGTYVVGFLKWYRYQIVLTSKEGSELRFPLTVIENMESEGVSLSVYLGALGLTGLTAYCGLVKTAEIKKGDIVFVSGAAGSTGGVAGQLAKIYGAKRVVGCAGSDDKCDYCVKELGFDACINYKKYPTVSQMKAAIAEVCPDGIDVYYDNVGGMISDAAWMNMNMYGRITVCGFISIYNDDYDTFEKDLENRKYSSSISGDRMITLFLFKRLRAQGFIVSDSRPHFPEYVKTLKQYVRDGTLQCRETRTEGFENIFEAFFGMLQGKNTGKAIVKVVK